MMVLMMMMMLMMLMMMIMMMLIMMIMMMMMMINYDEIMIMITESMLSIIILIIISIIISIYHHHHHCVFADYSLESTVCLSGPLINFCLFNKYIVQKNSVWNVSCFAYTMTVSHTQWQCHNDTATMPQVHNYTTQLHTIAYTLQLQTNKPHFILLLLRSMVLRSLVYNLKPLTPLTRWLFFGFLGLWS